MTKIGNHFRTFGRNVPTKPRLISGVKGHNMSDNTFPGSPAVWAGSFTFGIVPN